MKLNAHDHLTRTHDAIMDQINDLLADFQDKTVEPYNNFIQRQRQEIKTVVSVTDDGDGNLTVKLDNGAWLTVCPGDLPRRPAPGDRVIAQLPMLVGFDERKPNDKDHGTPVASKLDRSGGTERRRPRSSRRSVVQTRSQVLMRRAVPCISLLGLLCF